MLLGVITGDGIATSQTDMRVRVRFSDDRYIACALVEVRCAAAPSAPPVSQLLALLRFVQRGSPYSLNTADLSRARS